MKRISLKAISAFPVQLMIVTEDVWKGIPPNDGLALRAWCSNRLQ